MSIAWKYIDKPAATIAAVCDYTNMQSVIEITPDAIKEMQARMVSPRSAKMTGMPRAKNPRGNENALVHAMDTLDILQERYQQAVEYMAWFEPAWNVLSDEERLILQEFYMSGNQRSGATTRLQAELSYSDRQVERLRHKSLTRLSILLFGK